VADGPIAVVAGPTPGPMGLLDAALRGNAHDPIAWAAMSKRTVKRKIRSKKKANHGKRPNCGRG
jgi:hypothetical protein